MIVDTFTVNGRSFVVSTPQSITKRDGRVVAFDRERITGAIQRCFEAIGRKPVTRLDDLTDRVVNLAAGRYSSLTVENIQDTVEAVLQAAGEYQAAKAYILYRADHQRLRSERPVPLEVKAAFEESARYFPTALQQFQFYDKYSRFDYALGRRETWIETVTRSTDFLAELSGGALGSEVYGQIYNAILEMRAMPSMRLLAMAGPAARRNNISIFNCSFGPVDCLDMFVEALIISMSGCGVGFSVERQYIENLPRVVRQGQQKPIRHTIEDSSEGWADALRMGLELWFSGGDAVFDYSQIRLAGAPLKTKGGRASGPEPLRKMLQFVRSRILARQGGVLRPLDAHDIMCAIGNAAVAGGVRRTAMISLFDYDDHEMKHSKDGDFARENSQRWNANNSAVWPDGGPTQFEFARQFLEMAESGRGEPGIFSRENAQKTRPERRKRAPIGTNPCAEILLLANSFCNLSNVPARPHDTMETMAEKVRLATIMGTIQSMATNFPGLRDIWRQNCEDERLLGVDITGQLDSPIAQDAEVLARLKQVAIDTNREYAARLGINQSVAITCVKPSGNSSVLLDTSPGIHARHAPYYIRNVRVSAHSPLFRIMRDAGAPMDPDNGQTPESATTWVIHFPVKAPEGAIVKRDLSAIAQCEIWLRNKLNWTEHNPSATITYGPTEIIDLMAWVWQHREKIGGLSFLPIDDAQYDQMPYVEISEDEYNRLAANFPAVDFSKVWRYEESDLTEAAQELACVSGACNL